MRRIGAVLALGLVLAGCSSNTKGASNDHPVDPHTPAVTPSQKVTPANPTVFFVPTTSKVLGNWRIVSVNGSRPPKNSASLLIMARTHGKYFAGWDDGINSHSQQWFLKQGKIRWGGGSMTAVGCPASAGDRCNRPGGFGVGEATRVRMTNEGDLVFMDQSSTPLAIYKRVFKDTLAAGRALDPLTITLVLGTRNGDAVSSRIRVENNSGHSVSNEGCPFSNYSWGVVPAAKPGKALFRSVISKGCAQPRGLPNGFVDTFKGPTFSLTEGPSSALRSLPPGDYLATIDFGDARSERLTAKITINVTLPAG